jgi:hypothetical protein
MAQINLTDLAENNFSAFAENILFVIGACYLIRDKYKQITRLGENYKYIYDNIEVFHRVSNEDHDLCKEFISKIMEKIQENMQFCLDEYNLNIHPPDQKQKIMDIIYLMDILKYKLEKISPLDFIVEINTEEQEEEQEQEEYEYEIGPYDDLNGCENSSNFSLYYEYDGYDGYDN